MVLKSSAMVSIKPSTPKPGSTFWMTSRHQGQAHIEQLLSWTNTPWSWTHLRSRPHWLSRHPSWLPWSHRCGQSSSFGPSMELGENGRPNKKWEVGQRRNVKASTLNTFLWICFTILINFENQVHVENWVQLVEPYPSYPSSRPRLQVSCYPCF